ncbi:MAG TPA: TIGR02757 family protein [Rikenellaceae bacterium]|nr:TIGR02757 family protein [Rikenellaceae bacterium]
MTEELKTQLMDWADKYNDPVYFSTDPIAFPKEFVRRKARLEDVEIGAIFAAHFAWGRRAMIVRDCERLFDFMEWKPYDYVISGCWRDDNTSIHRTVKWSDTARICHTLKDFYTTHKSLEEYNTAQIRTLIFGQKEDRRAPDKKIRMMQRWMVRRDGKVDLGIWHSSDPSELIIPLDVHVYTQATSIGLTARRQKDLLTAQEITNAFKEIFPNDPCKGDFALFGYGIDNA